MKTIVIVIFTLLLSTNLNAQWYPSIFLTTTSGLNFFPNCVASENYVSVYWTDNRYGSFEIIQLISSDGGLSWSNENRLTFAGNSVNSFAYSSNNYIHLLWTDNRDGNNEVYYKRSTDRGLTWGQDTRLTNDPAISVSNKFGNTVCGSQSNIYAVWHDNRDGSNEIYFKRSINNGDNWGPDIRFTNDTANSYDAVVSTTENNVYVLWKDIRTGQPQIFFKRSSDYGISWDNEMQLTNYPVYWSRHRLYSNGDNIYMVWQDSSTIPMKIKLKRSTNAGMSWQPEEIIANPINGLAHNPYLIVSQQYFHLVYTTYYGSNQQWIYYKKSTDNGISWGNEILVSDVSSTVSYFPMICTSGQNLYLTFGTNVPTTGSIYLRRNPTGNLITTINNNTGIPEQFKLEQNYPNPFNPATKIKYDIPQSDFVSLVVYDISGKMISTLISEYKNAGSYETEWNAVNYPSGVYFYKLKAGKNYETKKMILMK